MSVTPYPARGAEVDTWRDPLKETIDSQVFDITYGVVNAVAANRRIGIGSRCSAIDAPVTTTAVSPTITPVPFMAIHDLPGLGRMVTVDCFIPEARHSVANAGVQLVLYGYETTQIPYGTILGFSEVRSPVVGADTGRPTFLRYQRLLQSGENWSFSIGFSGTQAGTSTLVASPTSHATLSAVIR